MDEQSNSGSRKSTGVSVSRSMISLAFGATILLSAFLLFQVQPIIGKVILPWFGSAPAVWTTCLMFFQVMLLVGYVYAHLIVMRLSPRNQALTHGLLLIVAVLFLPIMPSESWAMNHYDGVPTLQILSLLLVSVGIPFTLLATTGPLLQGWYSRLCPGRSVYRLYALSNVGSLLGLLTYPLVFERYFPLEAQTGGWSDGFVLFALFCAFCAWQAGRARGRPLVSDDVAAEEATASQRSGWKQVLLWVLFAACGSGLLMGSTNWLCMDIAVVPLLWILPLTIYLLTFVICFDRDHWYARPVFVVLLPVAVGTAVISLSRGVYHSITTQILTGSVTLFICLMCCHGELARLKPPARSLTAFFLAVSFGGAVGGIFVAVISPSLFSDVWEYHLLLALCLVLVFSSVFPAKRAFKGPWGTTGRMVAACTVVLVAVTATLLFGWPDAWLPLRADGLPMIRVDLAFWTAGGLILILASIFLLMLGRADDASGLGSDSAHRKRRLRAALHLAVFLAGIPVVGALGWDVLRGREGLVARQRNFFGVLKIVESEEGLARRLTLKHGRIIHGFQLTNPIVRNLPTSYYGPRSGIGMAIRKHPERQTPDRQFRLGVIGLGVGTIASYLNATILERVGKVPYVGPRPRSEPDLAVIYEINPLVEDWAERYFTFLEDARSRGASIVEYSGDARIVMERQLHEGRDQHFDLLVVDAFSSDAIPIHLLTRESFEIYRRHLHPDGILAINVSSRHLRLAPVVYRLAEEIDLHPLFFSNRKDPNVGVYRSDWVLLTNNEQFLSDPEVRTSRLFDQPVGPLWTDDYSSIIPLLR